MKKNKEEKTRKADCFEIRSSLQLKHCPDVIAQCKCRAMENHPPEQMIKSGNRDNPNIAPQVSEKVCCTQARDTQKRKA